MPLPEGRAKGRPGPGADEGLEPLAERPDVVLVASAGGGRCRVGPGRHRLRPAPCHVSFTVMADIYSVCLVVSVDQSDRFTSYTCMYYELVDRLYA